MHDEMVACVLECLLEKPQCDLFSQRPPDPILLGGEVSQCVVPGVQPLHVQGQDGIKCAFHVDSFRGSSSSKQPENKDYRENLYVGIPWTTMRAGKSGKCLGRSVA